MSKSEPYFSIIIPAYNRPHLLRECLQSIVHQSFDDWEALVVDDGSEESLYPVIEEINDSRIKYIRQEHLERSIARNKGIEESKGRFLCFMDDDDLLLPHYLQVFEKEISKSLEPRILRAGFLRLENGKTRKMPLYQSSKHKHPARFMVQNMAQVMTMCFKREFLEEDRFPDEFPHWQDTHLFLRLVSKYPFIQLNEYTSIYRIHDQRQSIIALRPENIMERAKLNTAAIHDFFTKYKGIIQFILPENTCRYLIAEKYLQYALNDMVVNGGGHENEFIRNSLKAHISFRFIKYYMQILWQKIRIFIKKI
ncbi:MAG TPA: glycosyltransferase family A protein [Saprospiraceae bacterium]|nr:glycosyltransferase family A protein [Saprospiraceae bacterium]